MQKKLGAATRDAYGKALLELGKTNPRVVVMDADLSKSTKSYDFSKAFHQRRYSGSQSGRSGVRPGGLRQNSVHLQLCFFFDLQRV